MNSLAPWLNDPTQMSPTTNLGLQLLANSNTPGGFGSIFGRSALQAGQNYQDSMLKQLQLQQLQGSVGFNNALNQAYVNALQSGSPGQVQNGLPAQSGAPQPQQGGLFGAPQAPQTSDGQTSQVPALPQPLTPDQVHSISVGGMPANLSILAKARANGGDFAAGAKEVEALQYEQAQRQYMPAISTFDNIINSASPSDLIKRNMSLTAAWPRIAAAANVDPADKSDDNVRYALSAYRNALATGVNLPTVAPTVPHQTIKGPLGSEFDYNPVNHEKKEIKKEESLEDVDLGNGQHAMLPTSQAAGKPKFSPFAAVDETSVEEQAKAIASYRQAPFSGNAARSPQAAAVMRAVYQVNPNYDATQFGAKNAALKSFMAGKDGQTLDSVNTAVAHLQQLRDLAAALKNGNMTAINAARQTVSSWFGDNVPTSFDAVRNLAAGEVNKIATGGPGAEGDRDAARNSFLRSASPDQLTGNIDNVTGLMAGRLNSVRNRFKVATKMDDAAFDGMLLPETRVAMAAHGGGPPQTTAAGKTLVYNPQTGKFE